MAYILSGTEVAATLQHALQLRTKLLLERGVQPSLLLIRLGNDPSDLSYRSGTLRRAEAIGIRVEETVLPMDAPAEAVIEAIERANRDDSIHGVLLFRPLPAHLRRHQQEICDHLDPRKDVDGMTRRSITAMYTGGKEGFAPCTPAAVMQIIRFFGFRLEGANVAVIGRSVVVGRPVAMMLLQADATVTICHTKTKDIDQICRQADIIITCAGALRSLTARHVKPGQVVIDVSMNFDPEKLNSRGEKGAMAGDADFEEVSPIVRAITPVPGGVGAVTSMMLMRHTIEAAENTVPPCR